MHPDTFAQAIVNEALRKLRELGIEVHEGGSMAFAVDETTGVGIVVRVSPGHRAKAKTAATSPQFPRLHAAEK